MAVRAAQHSRIRLMIRAWGALLDWSNCTSRPGHPSFRQPKTDIVAASQHALLAPGSWPLDVSTLSALSGVNATLTSIEHTVIAIRPQCILGVGTCCLTIPRGSSQLADCNTPAAEKYFYNFSSSESLLLILQHASSGMHPTASPQGSAAPSGREDFEGNGGNPI